VSDPGPPRAVLDSDVIFSRVLHELFGRLASELHRDNALEHRDCGNVLAALATEAHLHSPLTGTAASRSPNGRVSARSGQIMN
jgi:hypothetical protein